MLSPIESIPVIARGYEPSTTSKTTNIAATVNILIVLNWLTVSFAKSRVEAASESQNAATKTNGEGVAAGHDAEVIALVPPTPSEAEHQTKDRGPVR